MTQDGDQGDQRPTLLDIHFGKRLHLRRTMLDVDRWTLGNLVAVSAAEIGQLEDGKKCFDATLVYRLSKALEVPVYWFYDGLGMIDEIMVSARQGTAARSAGLAIEQATQAQRTETLLAYFDALDGERQGVVLELARLLATKEREVKRASTS